MIRFYQLHNNFQDKIKYMLYFLQRKFLHYLKGKLLLYWIMLYITGFRKITGLKNCVEQIILYNLRFRDTNLYIYVKIHRHSSTMQRKEIDKSFGILRKVNQQHLIDMIQKSFKLLIMTFFRYGTCN